MSGSAATIWFVSREDELRKLREAEFNPRPVRQKPDVVVDASEPSDPVADPSRFRTIREAGSHITALDRVSAAYAAKRAAEAECKAAVLAAAAQSSARGIAKAAGVSHPAILNVLGTR